MTPSQAQLKPCGCGGQRAGNKTICFPCWQSAPAALRTQSLEARTNAEVQTAITALRAHAQTRNLQPQLI